MKNPTGLAIIIILLAMGLILIPFTILPTESWISPDGHIETDGWLNEENVYDGAHNTETETAEAYYDTEWGPTLTLTYSSPINASRVKITLDAIPFRKFDVQVFLNGSWERVFFGIFPEYKNNIYSFDHGLVNQIKIRPQIVDVGSPYVSLYFYLSEIQLYGSVYEEPEEEPLPPEEEPPEDIPEEIPEEEPLEDVPEEEPTEEPGEEETPDTGKDQTFLQFSIPTLVTVVLIAVAILYSRKR